MTKHRLYTPGMFDPRWWRSLNRRSTSIVDTNGAVPLEGVLLTGCPYPPGTPVELFVGNNIECTSTEEYVQHQKELSERAAQREETERARKNKDRDDAEKFFSAYQLPFQYTTTINGHLHGLGERSCGNGFTKNTVIHMATVNAFTDGKIHRKAGEKICLSSGKNYSGQDNSPLSRFDGNNLAYTPTVTCKKCLEIMVRWLKDPS